MVHNDTSTGTVSRIPEFARQSKRAAHPAFADWDTISALGSVNYWHDEWGGCRVEMGLALAGAPIRRAGARAALNYLESAGR